MRMTWWRWGLAGLGGVLALFVVMYGVGAMLPVAHTATVSAYIDAPPERVWALITDIEAFPDWRPDVERATRLDDRDGRPAWRETMSTGAITFVVEEWDPPRRLVGRIADDDLPFGGAWTYRVEPDGLGARLTITEDGEVYNPLFRFMSRFIFGHESTMRSYLDAVGEALAADAG
jgi:uncharacterized protein YndB with AHSA1/START domain